MQRISTSNKNGLIIDRTILEILAFDKKANRVRLAELCELLVCMGVDLIEIDYEGLQFLGYLAKRIEFLYRLSQQNKEVFIPENIKNCLASEEIINDKYLIETLSKRGIKLTLEVRVFNIHQLLELRRFKDHENIKYVKRLRLIGLEAIDSPEWVQIAKDAANSLNLELDICAQNLYFNATATAFDALSAGVRAVTASFAGYGRFGGFTPVEEIMTCIKVLLGSHEDFKLYLLPMARKVFSELTDIIIPENKPLIGRDIFKYESGIHADGIEKDPTTYEPFDPGLVGQSRSLHIGKHSGRGAVLSKLKELGVNCTALDEAVVDTIREMSVKLKRGLCDEEIIELCGVPL